jgi:hypothetical protein
MLTPETPGTLPYLERLLLRLAPQWALRRAKARAAHAALLARSELDRRHPENVRYMSNGERGRRRASGYWKIDAEPPTERWQLRL